MKPELRTLRYYRLDDIKSYLAHDHNISNRDLRILEAWLSYLYYPATDSLIEFCGKSILEEKLYVYSHKNYDDGSLVIKNLVDIVIKHIGIKFYIDLENSFT